MRAKPTFFLFLLLPLFTLLGFCEEKSFLEDKVEAFFSVSNVSHGKSSYNDQDGLSLIGGSGYLRNEVSNIQPFNVSLPSLSIGCGGINYSMGAISTVSHVDMKKVLKNIAKGGASELFVLAIESTSPQISNMTAKIQHWQNQINAININSCEIGTSLAQGIWPSGTASKERICQQAASKQPFFRDRIEARHGCRDYRKKGTQKALSQAEEEGFLGDNFNLAWKVIKGNLLKEEQKFVDESDLHDLYLNISGTMISSTSSIETSEKKGEETPSLTPEEVKKKRETEKVAPSKKATLKFFPPRGKEAVNVLMNGGVLTGAYKFHPKEECSILTGEKITVLQGKKSKIQTALKSLSKKIVSERTSSEKTSLNDEENELIQNSVFPIAKLVSVMAQHNGNLTNSFLSIDQIAGEIAFDSVCSYVESVLSKLLSFLREIEAQQLNNSQTILYKESLEKALEELRFEKMKNLEQTSNWQNLLQFLIDVERNLEKPSGGD